MDLQEILKEIPAIYPLILTGGIITGMAIQLSVAIYKNNKKTNVRLKKLQETYKDNFSKEELMPFYEEALDVKTHVVFKNANTVYKIVRDLEKQIMTYATQEVNTAINNGTTLDFYDPIIAQSPIYAKALEIKESKKIVR